MRTFVSLIDPRTAVAVGTDYATVDAALAAADEADEDFFVLVETEDFEILRDTRPEEWMRALHPERN